MPHIPSYDCTSSNVWIDLEALESQYMDSNLKNHVLAIKIIGVCKIPIYLLQFVAHYRLMMRYFNDGYLDALGYSIARGISVGLPVNSNEV